MILAQDLFNRILTIVLKNKVTDGYAIGVSKNNNSYGISVTFTHKKPGIPDPVNISSELDISDITTDPVAISDRIKAFMEQMDATFRDMQKNINESKAEFFANAMPIEPANIDPQLGVMTNPLSTIRRHNDRVYN
jgi:hypothetical protein